MVHVVSAGALSGIGLLITLPAARSEFGAPLLAPAVGASLYITVGTFMLVLGLFNPLIALSISGALAFGYFWRSRRGSARPELREWVWSLAIALAMVTVVGVVFLNWHTPRPLLAVVT